VNASCTLVALAHTHMTTAAALVTLGLAFTAPASRLAPPRVSSARMMCAAVMPETPPALESDCGFDHVPLSIALQSGDFLEADQITRDALIKLAGDSAVSRGYVYFAEVPNLPEADLATIERLWLAYSGGKFGYSVQVKVLQSKKVNNNLEKLFDKIGWRNEKGQLLRWLPEKANNEFIYELDAAPEGHLPLTNTLRGQQLITALFKHPVWARDEFQ